MKEPDLTALSAMLETCFASFDEVVLAYLFGSCARGQTWAHSDVDVAVLLAGQPDDDHCLDMRLEIMGSLMDVLHTNEVDVLILNQAPPALRYAVLREGVLLFCRDRQAMVMFRLRTLNDYLDFKPILQRHENALLEKARRGELLHGYNPYQGALERYRQLRERLAHLSTADV